MRQPFPCDTAGVKVGDVVADRFVIEQLSAVGGMGTIWRAIDHHTDERAAIKVVTLSDAQGLAHG